MPALALEEFPLGDHPFSAEKTAANSAPDEAQLMQSYDRGYQAGWDDALASDQNERTRIDAEFARNLEELSVTFAEAQRQVCLSLESLVLALLEQVLPEVYQDHFPALVERTILPILRECGHLTAELLCAPEDRPVIEDLLAGKGTPPFSLRVEPSFARHQLRIQVGHERHEINGARLLEEMRNEIENFYTEIAEQAKDVS